MTVIMVVTVGLVTMWARNNGRNSMAVIMVVTVVTVLVTMWARNNGRNCGPGGKVRSYRS